MQTISSSKINFSYRSLLFYCLLLFGVSRILFFALAYYLNQVKGFAIAPDYLFSQLDSVWYLMIVKHGYTNHMHLDVFFPLLPLLVKGLVSCTHLTIHIAGQVVVNLAFLFASFLFYYWLAKECGVKTARIGVALLNFTPYSIYFMAFYTESVFLFLSLGFWVAARNKQWLIMSVFGALLSACHPNGVLVLLFAFCFMTWDYIKPSTPIWKIFCFCFLILIPSGLLAYMYYLQVHFGNSLNFVADQHYWSRALGWPSHDVKLAVVNAIYAQPYNFAVYIAGLILSLYLLMRGYYLEALFIPVMTAMAVASGSFVALARYTATLFPMYLAGALLLGSFGTIVATLLTIIAVIVEIYFAYDFIYLWLSHASMVY